MTNNVYQTSVRSAALLEMEARDSTCTKIQGKTTEGHKTEEQEKRPEEPKHIDRSNKRGEGRRRAEGWVWGLGVYGTRVVLSCWSCTHGQKLATCTDSWFDLDPCTRIHNCRGLRGRRHARTASFHHVHGQSRKINQEILFQGVDLEVFFFFASLFHLTLCRQPHSLSVCEDSVSDAHQASRRYSDSLSLTHTLSHTLSLFQVRSGPSQRSFWFCLSRKRSGKREVLSNPCTNYSVIESTTSSAHWRSTHRHACQSAKPPTDPRKVFPGKQTSNILAFLEKEVYFWDSWRLPWAG